MSFHSFWTRKTWILWGAGFLAFVGYLYFQHSDYPLQNGDATSVNPQYEPWGNSHLPRTYNIATAQDKNYLLNPIAVQSQNQVRASFGGGSAPVTMQGQRYKLTGSFQVNNTEQAPAAPSH